MKLIQFKPELSLGKHITRIGMGLAMIFAGISHLTFKRTEFQAQVPKWIPVNQDVVVIGSGVIEILLGLAMLFLKKKERAGLMLAIFYCLIFPGNISQYTNRVDAFGLNTDQARLIRLFFQPVLVFLAIWSTHSRKQLRQYLR